MLGIWLALLSGFGEVALRLAQRFAFGAKNSLGFNFVWMTPVALILLFTAAALLLLLVARLSRRPLPATVVLSAFLFLAIAGPNEAIGRINRIAALILAAGLAVQSARLLAPRTAWLVAAARRTAPVLVAGTLLLAIVGLLRDDVAERRGLAALAEPAPGTSNVLLIILDTVRAVSMSVYGAANPTTPNLERLAESGTVFDNAWSTSPWTLPAHASMFTGRLAQEMTTNFIAPLDTRDPTIAEHFGNRGYATAGFVANLEYTTREYGLARGFLHYDDFPVTLRATINAALLTRSIAHRVRKFGRNDKLVRKSAADINDSFLEWLDRPRERPFFAFLNYFDAHAPYLPPDSFAGRFGPRRTGLAYHDLLSRQEWSDHEIAAELAAYEGALAYLDDELGRLFGELEQRGLLDRTIVVVTSDHGEQFGEHGLMDHGNSLYSPLLRVPLLIRYPQRVPTALRIGQHVSLRDLPATLVDLSGTAPASFPGASLARTWRGRDSGSEPLFAEVRDGIRPSSWLPIAKGELRSVIADGYHYIQNGDGSEELYHLANDPDELRDLDALELMRPVLERMRSLVVRAWTFPGNENARVSRAPNEDQSRAAMRAF
ncbi:MAG: sulfatase [Longimicrobiales bacterium]